MNWQTMIEIEPELQRLADSAENAGRHNANWLSTIQAMAEPLSKCCGHSCHREQLRHDHLYETARARLFTSWLRGHRDADNSESPPAPADSFPWRGPQPGQPCEPVEQMTLFDVSEVYR